tara:strand:+ start:1533 stop:1670 length:138 start_codon:yes stop_codon:yes gene_type:complete
MASTPYNIGATVDLPLNPLIYRLSCRLTPFPYVDNIVQNSEVVLV